jgi:hypothetical protein
MGAYNYVVFEDVCPSCGERSRIRAQTHVASSFDGDDRGRFCHKDYQLEETMAWWPKTDSAGWQSWLEGADEVVGDGVGACEHCYADCEACKAELVVTIDFRDAVPTATRNLRVYDGVPL